MADSTAQTYRDAAIQHLERARKCFFAEEGSEDYFMAHYLAGLAVECYLRAWLRRRTDVFESRHDLRSLADESGFYEPLPQKQSERFAQSFGTLNLRWRSNHRYYSERQFLDYMNEVQAEQKTKGHRSKNLCRTVLNLAIEVINSGEARWEQDAAASRKDIGSVAGRRNRRLR